MTPPSPPSPHGRTARAQPILLQRRTPGDGGPDPRVLLLHGMADSAAVWERLCALVPSREALRRAEFFTAELPWRGTGPADWAHVTEPSLWLAETLDTLAATAGPADIVVGHSFSALLLLDLLCGPAATGGHRVGGLVLVSPFYRPRAADFDWNMMAGLAERFVRTMEEGIRVAAGTRGKPALHRAMAERLCETIGAYGWSRFFELYLRTPWLRTGSLRTPTLVVSGAGDRIAVTAEAAALAARLPAATLHTIDATGHFPMAERPAAFADALDGFVRRRAPEPEVERI